MAMAPLLSASACIRSSPKAVIKIAGAEARGSARSIPEFDLVAALLVVEQQSVDRGHLGANIIEKQR